MRYEDKYFRRLRDKLWGMLKIYCLPKLKTSLKVINIEGGLVDIEEVEDWYMTEAIMW